MEATTSYYDSVENPLYESLEEAKHSMRLERSKSTYEIIVRRRERRYTDTGGLRQGANVSQ